jgi:hypothetical protein
MATKLTSSADRSKRKTNKPVRSDKGRSNRQKASTANVTNDGARKKNSGAKVTNASQRPGGGNAKVTTSSRPALPPGKRGADLKQKGGDLVRSGSNKPDAPTKKVRVQDLGKSSKPAMKGGTTQSLASAKGGGGPLQAADGRNVPLNSKGWPKGTSSWADSGSPSPKAARVASTAAKASVRGVASRALVPIAIASQTADTVKGFKQLSEHPFLTKNKGNSSSQSSSSGGTRRAGQNDKVYSLPTSPSAGRRVNPAQARRNRQAATSERQGPPVPARLKNAPPAPNLPSPTSTARSANDAQASRSSAQREAVGGRTAAPATRQSVTRPSQAQPRTSSGTAGTGRKWEDFNKGRGTSETNNPLIAKDSWLMGKIKQREEGQAKNVGPSKDGKEYSSAKQAADIVARRKKKEEEDKKKSAS